MARRYIDCRDYPSDMHCSVKISADTDDELLTAAVQHACSVHGHSDSPQLQSQLRQMFKTDMTSERKAA